MEPHEPRVEREHGLHVVRVAREHALVVAVHSGAPRGGPRVERVDERAAHHAEAPALAPASAHGPERHREVERHRVALLPHARQLEDAPRRERVGDAHAVDLRDGRLAPARHAHVETERRRPLGLDREEDLAVRRIRRLFADGHLHVPEVEGRRAGREEVRIDGVALHVEDVAGDARDAAAVVVRAAVVVAPEVRPLAVERRVVAQPAPVARLRCEKRVVDRPLHQVAHEREVRRAEADQAVEHEQLVDGEARLAHAALAVLVVGPALRDAARAGHQRAVAVQHEVKRAERRAEELRVGLKPVHLQLRERRAEIAVGLAVEHLAAADHDRQLPLLQRALVQQEVAVSRVLRGGVEPRDAEAEPERPLAVGDEIELPVRGHVLPVREHVVRAPFRRLEGGLVAVLLVFRHQALEQKTRVMQVPEGLHAALGAQVAEIPVRALRLEDRADDGFLARHHVRLAGVAREMHGRVRELAEPHEPARRRLLAKRFEEGLLQVELHEVVGGRQIDAPAQHAAEADAVRRHGVPCVARARRRRQRRATDENRIRFHFHASLSASAICACRTRTVSD